MKDIEKIIKKEIEKSEYYSQIEVLVDMISGRNLYLSGPAGSGKSYVIRKFVDYMTRNAPNYEIALTAPQGTAAVNINGKTIHSFTGMGVSQLDFEDRGGVSKFAEKQMKKTDILVIDEVSMLSAWQLRFILEAFKFYKRNIWHNTQVIVSGDFTQLPPVAKTTDPAEMAQLCYGSASWREFNFKNTYMDRVYRAEDEKLKNLLNKIALGEGEPSDLEGIKVIDSTDGLSAPILVSTNKVADRINKENHDANISFNEKTFYLDIRKDKGTKYEDASMLFAKQSSMDKPVKVKTNDVVMITVNENRFNSYCKHLNKNSPYLQNGMIGRVSEIVDNEDIGIVFEYRDPDTEKVYHYLIERKCVFEQTVIKTDKQGKKYEEVVASFSQVPFKLAYAISIHKSQGQTYSHVVADLSNCWLENLGYVALSRSKSINGLYLLNNNGKILGNKSLKVNKESVAIKKEVFKDSYIGTKEERFEILMKKIKDNNIVVEDLLDIDE